MRRRFFWGMVGVALATALVGGLTAALLVQRAVEQAVRTEFARQAEATARLLEIDLPPSGVPRPGDNRVRLGQILREAALVGGHEFVEAAVVGPRGAVTVLGEDGDLLDQVPGLATLAAPVAFDAEVDGGTVAAVAHPIRLGARGTMVVVIGTRLDLVPWGEVAGRFLVAVVIGVALAAGLAAWLSGFAGRRLNALRRASQQVAGGDLAARVPVEGGDELAEVAGAFNEMAAGLEAARRREREFLVSVGHELRTPLTTISGYAEAMSEGRLTATDLGRVGGALGESSERLRRLVEDLMLLSRIEAAEFSLRTEPVDLAAHLGGVVEGFRRDAAAADIALEAVLRPVGSVVVDPDRVAQMVANLVQNALCYTPSGGRVTVGLDRSPGGEFQITVADTGPGIDAADLPRVFDRMYVATRYRPLRPEGSGLGLSIVRQLAGAMGGRAEVDSRPGSGSTFRVTVPAVAAEAATPSLGT